MDFRSTARCFLGAMAAAFICGCAAGGPSTTGGAIMGSGDSLESSVHRAVAHNSTSKAARERLGLAPAQRPSRSWFNRKITQNVFLADEANGAVDIFDFSSRQQSGEIVGFDSPEGLATDAAGNLYVADTLAQTIEVFATPYSG
ncbi:MAG: hypothetical protein IAI50_06930, partial [Candidatus Eremiobacteraeota bacterium]|nr:hypothetical protein [Candidatus Eremiobacteraeota bacterium]